LRASDELEWEQVAPDQSRGGLLRNGRVALNGASGVEVR
jgi:hypothetical protein